MSTVIYKPSSMSYKEFSIPLEIQIYSSNKESYYSIYDYNHFHFYSIAFFNHNYVILKRSPENGARHRIQISIRN